MEGIKHIKELTEIEGKWVLLRLDLNVPIENGEVASAFRIEKELPTIRLLQEKKARIIAISHMGDKHASLEPIHSFLSKVLPLEFFPDTFFSDGLRKKVNEIAPGNILLLENLRKFSGEEENEEEIAKQFASLADVYVNEAFSVSHRNHMSIVSIPKFLPSYAGMLFMDEVRNLSKALHPENPFYVVLGGAKIGTKLGLVKRFLPSAEKIFIYGALAHDLMKERGYEIGKSLADPDPDTDIQNFLSEEKIILPKDVVVRDENGNKVTRRAEDVKKEDIILDAGLESVRDIENAVRGAKTILWNGPLGNFEEGFCEGTEMLAAVIGNTTAFSIVGGGDTIAAIDKLNIFEKFGFVSTGGGAMLDFLAHGTLPGIEALRQRA